MLRATCLFVAALTAGMTSTGGLASNAAGDESPEIEVSAVLVKLIEQVDVPAREAGVLEEVSVREGQMIDAGAAVAQIDDTAARFDKRKAELELEGARKLADSDVKVRFARKSAEVAESELRPRCAANASWPKACRLPSWINCA